MVSLGKLVSKWGEIVRLCAGHLMVLFNVLLRTKLVLLVPSNRRVVRVLYTAGHSLAVGSQRSGGSFCRLEPVSIRQCMIRSP